MSNIPQAYQDLLGKKALANLATVNADGSPQVTPVWFEWDGEHVVFNTAVGRLKDRNLQRQPHAALAIVDPDNIYRYIQIRGPIVERTENGADASIDRLAHKYLGVDKYPYGRPGEKRVMYKMLPEKVQAMG